MTPRRLFQVVGWLCVVAIVVLSLVAPSLRPVTFLPHDLEHAAIFIITGLALGLGYPGRTAQHMMMHGRSSRRRSSWRSSMRRDATRA